LEEEEKYLPNLEREALFSDEFFPKQNKERKNKISSKENEEEESEKVLITNYLPELSDEHIFNEELSPEKEDQLGFGEKPVDLELEEKEDLPEEDLEFGEKQVDLELEEKEEELPEEEDEEERYKKRKLEEPQLDQENIFSDTLEGNPEEFVFEKKENIFDNEEIEEEDNESQKEESKKRNKRRSSEENSSEEDLGFNEKEVELIKEEPIIKERQLEHLEEPFTETFMPSKETEEELNINSNSKRDLIIEEKDEYPLNLYNSDRVILNDTFSFRKTEESNRKPYDDSAKIIQEFCAQIPMEEEEEIEEEKEKKKPSQRTKPKKLLRSQFNETLEPEEITFEDDEEAKIIQSFCAEGLVKPTEEKLKNSKPSVNKKRESEQIFIKEKSKDNSVDDEYADLIQEFCVKGLLSDEEEEKEKEEIKPILKEKQKPIQKEKEEEPMTEEEGAKLIQEFIASQKSDDYDAKKRTRKALDEIINNKKEENGIEGSISNKAYKMFINKSLENMVKSIKQMSDKKEPFEKIKEQSECHPSVGYMERQLKQESPFLRCKIEKQKQKEKPDEEVLLKLKELLERKKNQLKGNEITEILRQSEKAKQGFYHLFVLKEIIKANKRTKERRKLRLESNVIQSWEKYAQNNINSKNGSGEEVEEDERGKGNSSNSYRPKKVLSNKEIAMRITVPNGSKKGKYSSEDE
ncbi:MAG: hypothetical protein MJ252_25670, partial [archaeon]|nr:hypothetical protein [archaeon]